MENQTYLKIKPLPPLDNIIINEKVVKGGTGHLMSDSKRKAAKKKRKK